MDPLNHTDFKFHPQITQIGCYWGGAGHTELYLLEGERLAIVDTCTAPDPARYIAPALQSIGRSLADIDLIINSHGHYDHVGGNESLRQAAPECEILIHPADKEIAEDPDRQFEVLQRPAMELFGLQDQMEAGRQEMHRYMGRPPQISGVINDGDVIDLGRGIELNVLHTPGHSAGCVSLYWEREGIVLSCDSAPGNGSREGGSPLMLHPELYTASLRRLLDLDPSVLCMGHHYVVPGMTRESVKYGSDCRLYLEKCQEVADLYATATHEATKSGPDQPFSAIAHDVFIRLRERLALRPDPITGHIGLLGAHIIHRSYQQSLTAL